MGNTLLLDSVERAFKLETECQDQRLFSDYPSPDGASRVGGRRESEEEGRPVRERGGLYKRLQCKGMAEADEKTAGWDFSGGPPRKKGD